LGPSQSKFLVAPIVFVGLIIDGLLKKAVLVLKKWSWVLGLGLTGLSLEKINGLGLVT